SLGYAAWALWSLGYPDQAVERINEALALAKELSHTQSLILALYLAAVIHQLRREAATVQERAKEMIALTQEEGLPMWAAFGTIYCGWSQVEQGEMGKGIERLQRGLAAYQATGAKLWQTHFLGLLAEALAKMGKFEQGLNVLDKALATAREVGECYYEAEIYRLKGELLLKQGLQERSKVANSGSRIPLQEDSATFLLSQSDAEAFFAKAISIARQQQAKAWELRATINLSQLYKKQGKTNEAQQILAKIYGWFSEGFDTLDFREAQTLLSEFN